MWDEVIGGIKDDKKKLGFRVLSENIGILRQFFLTEITTPRTEFILNPCTRRDPTYVVSQKYMRQSFRCRKVLTKTEILTRV